MADEKKAEIKKKKIKRNVIRAVAHIHASFNNTIITFTDENGGVLCQASGGSVAMEGGKKLTGSRKATPFAAQKAAAFAASKAKRFGVRQIEIKVRGIGPARESAIRQLHASGFEIISIEDVTPIPHNGCRPPKKRSL